MIATATAAAFVWLGMVVAISFLETPLRFRAPGVDISTGLAIGRLVFRGLNVVELVLAATILLGVFSMPHRAALTALTAATLLLVQMCGIRPLLGRRSDQILAGSGAPSRSTSHHLYVVLEVAKVVALLATGVLLLAPA